MIAVYIPAPLLAPLIVDGRWLLNSLSGCKPDHDRGCTTGDTKE